MDITIRKCDPIGDEAEMVVARGINRDTLRIALSQGEETTRIVIAKQDLIDALKAL